ncbi:hypothetical protein BC629DRAFT_916236 [Irpex lacteus]|nr:hypothetical protein BC629DRAFT_916236 [Irpex lacteus]
MLVGRVLSFLSFAHEDVHYDTASLEWFLPFREEPDPVICMWIVKHEMQGRRRRVSRMHTNSTVRGCDLMGVYYGKHQLPRGFCLSFSLDTLQVFCFSHCTDYYAHQYIR